MTDEQALAEVLLIIKQVACPHCRCRGALTGHGFLRGYAEHSSLRVVRGRRFYCSNRALRPGCGRTFSVALMTVLSGFIVGTRTLLGFTQAVLSGSIAHLGAALGNGQSDLLAAFQAHTQSPVFGS